MWVDRRGSDVLPESECRRLLARAAARGDVARLAVSRAGAPIIHPVNFSYRRHHLFVRLGDGMMLEEAAGNLVSFEIDGLETEGETSWAWSVVGRGLASALWPGEHEPDVTDLPKPMVPIPGEHLLMVRIDVLGGRRFRLAADGDEPPDSGSVRRPSPSAAPIW